MSQQPDSTAQLTSEKRASQDSPKNPPRSQSQPIIQPTPYSTGTSANDRALKDTKIKDIIESYRKDLSQSQVLDFEPFLRALFSRVVDNNVGVAPYDLVLNHVQAVLDETLKQQYSATIKQKGKTNPSKSEYFHQSTSGGPSAESLGNDNVAQQAIWAETILAGLKSYCEAPGETDRYEPFVTVANTILEMFHDMTLIGLRSSSDHDDRIIFQVNDPNPLHGQHQTPNGYLLPDTCRKPDILILPINVAWKTVEGARTEVLTHADTTTKDNVPPFDHAPAQDHPPMVAIPLLGDHSSTQDDPSAKTRTKEDWKCYSTKHAGSRPMGNLRWVDTLMALEFKKDKRIEIPTSATFWEREYQRYEANKIVRSNESGPGASHSYSSDIGQSSLPRASSTSQVAMFDSATTSSHGSAAHLTERSGSAKCSRDESAGLSGSKRSRTSGYSTPAGEKISGPEQTVIYGGEKLCSQVNICHSFNMLIKDKILWIYYCDRAGILRTCGLDLIQNFAHFALLIVVLQRFTKSDWGYHEIFQQVNDNKFQLELSGPQGEAISITIPDSAKLALSLKGRATVVVGAKSNNQNPFNPKRSLNDEDLVAKIYHADTMRDSEAKILSEVYKASRYDDREVSFEAFTVKLPANPIRGHVPILVALRVANEPFYLTLLGCFTKKNPRRMSRRLVIMIFPRLKPLYELHPSKYWPAFLDCFNCHFALWQKGIHHRDVSSGNLMCYEFDGQSRGVLNDFDLAYRVSTSYTTTLERTGTLPYMAMEFLAKKKRSTTATHKYTHDAESFFYVIGWNTRGDANEHPHGTTAYDWHKSDPGPKNLYLTPPGETVPVNPYWHVLAHLRTNIHNYIRRMNFAYKWNKQGPLEVYTGYIQEFEHDTEEYASWDKHSKVLIIIQPLQLMILELSLAAHYLTPDNGGEIWNILDTCTWGGWGWMNRN